MPAMTNGYITQMQQNDGTNTIPVYPITKWDAVKNSSDSMTLTAKLAEIDARNYVPTLATGDAINDYTFLRNDGTFQAIPDASTSQKGVVQLTNSLTDASETTAATAAAAKSLKEAIDALADGAATSYVLKTQLGVATTVDNSDPENPVTVTGVATLGTDGRVPAAQLPSFVDDTVEVNITWDSNTGKSDQVTYATADDAGHTAGSAVTLEAGKIYVDVTNNKTYRYGGASTGLVEISSSLALGTTSSTAFRGDYGQIAYEHSQATHAMTDANKTEAVTSSDLDANEEPYGNGYIKTTDRNGNVTYILAYEHPQATGFGATNPHGLTASDLGLGNVENKSASTILDEITSTLIIEKLGYTPQNAATVASTSQNGVMSADMVKKLNATEEIYVQSTQPTPSVAGNGYLWLQIVEDETAGD